MAEKTEKFVLPTFFSKPTVDLSPLSTPSRSPVTQQSFKTQKLLPSKRRVPSPTNKNPINSQPQVQSTKNASCSNAGSNEDVAERDAEDQRYVVGLPPFIMEQQMAKSSLGESPTKKRRPPWYPAPNKTHKAPPQLASDILIKGPTKEKPTDLNAMWSKHCTHHFYEWMTMLPRERRQQGKLRQEAALAASRVLPNGKPAFIGSLGPYTADEEEKPESSPTPPTCLRVGCWQAYHKCVAVWNEYRPSSDRVIPEDHPDGLVVFDNYTDYLSSCGHLACDPSSTFGAPTVAETTFHVYKTQPTPGVTLTTSSLTTPQVETPDPASQTNSLLKGWRRAQAFHQAARPVITSIHTKGF